MFCWISICMRKLLLVLNCQCIVHVCTVLCIVTSYCNMHICVGALNMQYSSVFGLIDYFIPKLHAPYSSVISIRKWGMHYTVGMSDSRGFPRIHQLESSAKGTPKFKEFVQYQKWKERINPSAQKLAPITLHSCSRFLHVGKQLGIKHSWQTDCRSSWDTCIMGAPDLTSTHLSR